MSMMYVFICPKCGRSTMVSLYRSLKCRVCQADMANCELIFWIGWNWSQSRDRN